jgi:hypothetical protein
MSHLDIVTPCATAAEGVQTRDDFCSVSECVPFIRFLEAFAPNCEDLQGKNFYIEAIEHATNPICIEKASLISSLNVFSTITANRIEFM